MLYSDDNIGNYNQANSRFMSAEIIKTKDNFCILKLTSVPISFGIIPILMTFFPIPCIVAELLNSVFGVKIKRVNETLKEYVMKYKDYVSYFFTLIIIIIILFLYSKLRKLWLKRK